eukprot:TRINITY_DN39389_c0_g1_i1.p1 TRINITY_DN39389_c0_g1~~TRINITY_DN39389_c0_g1_i1.p1  ORF type:complete len:138 (+),score=25.54 TRINITY_DN39389_c0_g1_i1:338-751(+)
MAPSKKVSVTLSLPSEQVAWLNEIKATHNLPNKDKVLRILLTYAGEGTNRQQLFAKKGPQVNEDAESAEPSTFVVEDFHVALLESKMAEDGLFSTMSEVVCAAIDHVRREGNLEEVFGVIRCKHGETCSFCPPSTKT